MAESFLADPSPDELELRAPQRVRKNRAFRIRVVAYNDKGRARPVEGARVAGSGAEPTNAGGYTRIRIKRKTRLAARADGLIVSNRAVVRIRR